MKLIRFEEVSLLDDTNHVFVINAYHEHFPNLKKDNDMISDEQKQLIGIMDSQAENALMQDMFKALSHHPSIKQISFAHRDHNQYYQISDLILSYIRDSKDFKVLNIKDIHVHYAPLFYKQYFKNNDKGIKLTTFTGDFNLKEEEKKTLKRYLKHSHLRLSASGITTYLKVPFIFYLNQILKLRNFEDNLYLRSGNFFPSFS